jgi:hypothetical protein
MRGRLIVAASLSLGLLFASCRSTREQPPPVVEDLAYELNPSGTRIVSGKLFNPSDELIENVQIQVSLFDVANELVGSMSILVRDVGAGERVPFRETVDSDVVEAARVKSIVVM